MKSISLASNASRACRWSEMARHSTRSNLATFPPANGQCSAHVGPPLMVSPPSRECRGGKGIGRYCPGELGTAQSKPSQIGASLFRLLDAISGRAIAEDVIDLGCEVLVARAIAPFNCDKIDQTLQPCSGKGDRTARTSSTRRSRKSSRCSYGLRQPIHKLDQVDAGLIANLTPH
jgi:hypothetical protein